MNNAKNALSFPLPNGRIVIARLYGGTSDGWSVMDIAIEGSNGQTQTLFSVIHSEHHTEN